MSGYYGGYAGGPLSNPLPASVPSSTRQYYGGGGSGLMPVPTAVRPRGGTTAPTKWTPPSNWQITSPSNPLGSRPAYTNPAVREVVSKLIPSREQAKAAAADMQADYDAEIARIQGLLDQQNRIAERERQAQIALAKRERSSAYANVSKEFERHGLDGKEIQKALKGLAENDYLDKTTLVERIRETKTWADRFGAVTKERQKKGLSFKSEGEIVALEDGFRKVMSDANMPKGFYDSPKDFQHWIANEVSVQEVGERVALAEQAIANLDPEYVKTFKEFYGIKRSDLVPYFLDKKRGTEVLAQQIKAAEIGSEGKATGIDVNTKFAETLVDKGISRQEARSAFSKTAEVKADWQRLAGLSRDNISEQSLVEGELGLDPDAEIKKRRLASAERGRFGGSGGSSSAFGATRSGSY